MFFCFLFWHIITFRWIRGVRTFHHTVLVLFINGRCPRVPKQIQVLCLKYIYGIKHWCKWWCRSSGILQQELRIIWRYVNVKALQKLSLCQSLYLYVQSLQMYWKFACLIHKKHFVICILLILWFAASTWTFLRFCVGFCSGFCLYFIRISVSHSRLKSCLKENTKAPSTHNVPWLCVWVLVHTQVWVPDCPVISLTAISIATQAARAIFVVLRQTHDHPIDSIPLDQEASKNSHILQVASMGINLSASCAADNGL